MTLWGPNARATLLIIMIETIFLLCVFTKQVIGQTNDFFPARIFAQQKTLSEGSNLYITCSTFGSRKRTAVYVYLCKDGVGISAAAQKKEQDDAAFTIQQVGLHDTGNYSCIYSKAVYEPSEVHDTGSSKIHIQVISRILPADISVAGPATVREGRHIELTCTLSDTLQTLDECQLIQSYLRRNEIIVQVQSFNVTRMEATFTIEEAAMRDSGRYSCVVLLSTCIKANKELVYGNNSILIEVKVNLSSLLVQVLFFIGILSLMLSLGLCLWMNRNKYHSRHNPSAESQQPHRHMLVEQQEQNVESQDSGSFSVEEGESFQSDADSSYYNYAEEDRVYSVADNPAAMTYATSFKRKIKQSTDQVSAHPLGAAANT